ncbi:MAG: CRTAC1 family protein [Bryobacterales bacterium]|nr:CRTAC1 family protein [Bryobacterales bacterium]
MERSPRRSDELYDSRVYRRQLFVKTALAFFVGASLIWGQGIASRNVKPTPRSKPSGIPFNARFVDIAAQAGFKQSTIYGSAESKAYILEAVGCGAAFFDYDNDGWMDIFIVSGTQLEAAPAEATNRLYRNNRDGTFTDVTDKAGLRKAGWGGSVTAADYDNDGFSDLFITYWGQNALYRNRGDGTFEDTTQRANLLNKETRYGSGAAFFDYDRDGDLDLFVANYLIFDPKRVPRPGQSANCTWKGVPVNCGPRGLPPASHSLYRNNGDGTFTDVSAPAGIAKIGGSYGMTVVPADYDNDGWSDIYVACDSTPSFFFRNNHDGTFTESGLERGVALNEDGMEQAGMGVGIGDINLDGSLDILKTHFADDTSVVYRNDGKGNFDDITIASGVGVETRFVSWGAAITDLDNDGLPDLFIATGNVYPEIEKKVASYPYKTPRIIFRNLGNAKFEELIDEAGPGIAATHSSRGAAFGDFDNDGDIDVVIVNLGEVPSLLRNDLKPGNNWVTIQLRGTKSNRSAIGARVTARYGNRKQVQELTSQSSFYSSNDPRLHFGLGQAASATLEIRWPTGKSQTIENVKPNQLLTVTEP